MANVEPHSWKMWLIVLIKVRQRTAKPSLFPDFMTPPILLQPMAVDVFFGLVGMCNEAGTFDLVCLATNHATQRRLLFEDKCIQMCYQTIPFPTHCAVGALSLKLKFPRNTFSSTTASGGPLTQALKATRTKYFELHVTLSHCYTFLKNKVRRDQLVLYVWSK